MTAIKPPDGPPLKGPISPASANTTGAAGSAGPERTSATFRDALEQATAAGKAAAHTESAGASQGGAAPDAISDLATAVRSGALQPDQAVQQLVDRALSGVGGKLSEAQRLELTAVLRQALENDPALADLRKAVR
jgi:hypothetical protein